MLGRLRRHDEGALETAYDKSVYEAQAWFKDHVTLGGSPYTLDLDQARAAIDMHTNTIVTARAGSGKTRVIVAKITYLVAIRHLHLHEIMVFMFNRTAATEVNTRIADVKVDGKTLLELDSEASHEVMVASTFHKFALDTIKLAGQRPKILVGSEHEAAIRRAFDEVLSSKELKLSPRDYGEKLKLISSFIARAGQKYPGRQGISRLEADVAKYCLTHKSDPNYHESCVIHRLAIATYKQYLSELQDPLIDFNLLMAGATELLCRAAHDQIYPEVHDRLSCIRFLLIDEYQDFSYLFFAIIQAVRQLCPESHLFVVGDDWQAINRFAGSDVDYFINFAEYFPRDSINIPLQTNYRSARSIVENANDYMLKFYDPQASRAVAFSRDKGRIYRISPKKTHFDQSDLGEDALLDGRFALAIAEAYVGTDSNQDYIDFAHTKPCLAAAKLLKTLYKIFYHHRDEQIMLLHRHNFTSYEGITLEILYSALKIMIVREQLMSETDFQKQVRCMTMHKSKGLESEVVILLDFNEDVILSHHPHASLFTIFGDTIENEKADQHRLIYVALTRAKRKLYLLSDDQKCPA